MNGSRNDAASGVPFRAACRLALPATYASAARDASYGSAEILAELEGRASVNVNVQAPSAANGVFSKDRFAIDLEAGTLRCPAGQQVRTRPRSGGGGLAMFGSACLELRSAARGAAAHVACPPGAPQRRYSGRAAGRLAGLGEGPFGATFR